MSLIFYVTDLGDPDPKDLLKQQFTVHWWVTWGLGYDKSKAGWKGQVYKTHLDSFIKQSIDRGHKVVVGEHP